MSNRPDLGKYIDELYRDATKLVNLVEEVAQHYKASDHGSAALVPGLAHRTWRATCRIS